MDKMKRNLLAVSLILPSMAQAFGLGEITVHSRLGEPLRAEIAVTDPSGDEDRLKLALADQEAFYRVGLERTPYISGLQFRLVEREDGSQFIEVSSAAPAREPFLSFLLEANWSSGRMLKEYTLLLDPPVFTAGGAPAPETGAGPATTDDHDRKPADETMTTSTPVPAQPHAVDHHGEAADSGSATPVVEDYAATPSSYEVQAGDTLWEVARDVRPDAGIGINTMMIALLQTNPEAFIDNNINGLKRGAVLRVPDRSEIGAMGLEDARQLVREQNALWQQYRSDMAAEPATVSDATAYADPAGTDADTDMADARLRLVPPAGEDEAEASVNAAGTATDSAVAELEDELNRTREALAAKEQETSELASRVSELESLVDKLERAINIKDADLAALQAELEAARAALAEAGEPAEGETAVVPDGLPESDAADEATVDEPVGAEEASAQAEETPPVEEDLAVLVDDGAAPVEDQPLEGEFSLTDEMADEQVQGMEPAASEGVDATEETLPEEGDALGDEPESQPAVPMQPLTLDGAEQDEGGLFGLSWTTLAAAGGGVLLLLALLLLKRRSGKQDDESQSRETDGAKADADDAVQASEQSQQPSETEQDEEAVDFAAVESDGDAVDDSSQEDGEETSEAERDGQEDDLSDLVIDLDDEQDPDIDALVESDDSEVDLSDIYDGSEVDHPELEDQDGDDASLDSLFADEGEDAEDAVAESGAENESSEDVFDFDLHTDDETGQVEQDSDTAGDFDFDLDTDVSGAEDSAESEVQETDAEDDGLDFDFDLDDTDADDASALDTDESDGGALDLDDGGLTVEETEAEDIAEEDLQDFDFGELEQEAEAEDAAESTADTVADADEEQDMDAVEMEAVEEELDIPTEDLFEDEDSVSTKLDLARAYLDMGDPDGAKTMLEEVMQEGNDEQKAQAKELLDGMD